MTKYGFIGCGNMGSALIKAAVKAVNPETIYISDYDTEKASSLSSLTSTKNTNNKVIANECDFIFLGVKPQMMEDTINEIKDDLNKREDQFILVTMAAGITIKTIKKYAGDFPVIRIMPNLAVSVGEGMILYCSENVTKEKKNDFTNLMKYSGKLLEINESLMDAGCAVSGSSPAFTFMFIDALTKGAIKCGLSEKDSIFLACQTVYGAAKLLMESDKTAEELTKNVCSPGGTTIEGVKSLNINNFEDIATEAVLKAYERAKELNN